MKRFFGAIKRFFLPPSSASTLARVLPLATIAFLMLVLFVFSTYAWEATNAVSFCGLTCHTMPPEYTTHQNSAHANVTCEDCHMGRGSLAVMLPRKITYSWQTGTAMITNSYEYPIVAKNMRPARDACENCHKPETFTTDTLVELKHFASDETNSPTSTYLTLKIGGGTARQGLGRGIHWHIENPVYFYATDATRQTIPYVEVKNPDGTTTAYVDTESGFDPTSIQPSQLQKMDCITCHNRTAHGAQSPNDALDRLMARGLVSSSIPNIKTKGVELLGGEYASVKAAQDAIGALDTYYRTTYADFYSANQPLVSQAIQSLQEEFANTNFPEQKFNWQTHPDNIGHINSPGCFRCHDGKHLTPQDESIRLECNICHTIPVVADQNQINVALEINRGFEPESHQNTNWINLHRTTLDNSCAGCHTIDDPGGVSNTSFCSNSACHGSSYTYAGFDAPGLKKILVDVAAGLYTPTPLPSPTPLPTATPQPTATPNEDATPVDTPAATPVQTAKATTAPATGAVTYAQVSQLFVTRCGACHGTNGMKGLNLTTYAAIMKGSATGPVVIPGDPTNSLLVKIQSAKTPHFGQFKVDELTQVIQWIQGGALEK